jgi:indole-3-glycerol phosphate synthase
MLSKIIEKKKEFLDKRKKEIPQQEILEKLRQIKEENNFKFKQALLERREIKIITEIKRASPSKGDFISSDVNIINIAKTYEMNGAIAVSIVTDEFFKTSIEDFISVRKEISLPILRKDFVIDEYQIYESKFIGADAILLIARILEEEELRSFMSCATELGMSSVIEVHDEDDLKKSLTINPDIIGINNRNLENFKVNLETSERLLPKIPDNLIKICESGIHSNKDIFYLKSLGADAFLIGEELLTSVDISKKLRNLLGYD